jgi:hypothetical protein
MRKKGGANAPLVFQTNSLAAKRTMAATKIFLIQLKKSSRRREVEGVSKDVSSSGCPLERQKL